MSFSSNLLDGKAFEMLVNSFKIASLYPTMLQSCDFYKQESCYHCFHRIIGNADIKNRSIDWRARRYWQSISSPIKISRFDLMAFAKGMDCLLFTKSYLIHCIRGLRSLNCSNSVGAVNKQEIVARCSPESDYLSLTPVDPL